MRSTKAAQRDIATATTRWLLAFFMVVRVIFRRAGNSGRADATRFSYRGAKAVFFGNPMNQQKMVSNGLRGGVLKMDWDYSGGWAGVRKSFGKTFPLHHSDACLRVRAVLCPRRAIPAQAPYETKST